MIVENGLYFLYRHIRLDKNEVFYVGIGKKQKYCNYKRAFALDHRNIFWKRIVAKTNYEIEIILESDDYEFIKKKEIEFVALYGRRDLSLGTLVNLTDGGDGTLNWKPSREAINKRIDKSAIKIINVKTGKIYNSIKEASLDSEYTLHKFRMKLYNDDLDFKFLDNRKIIKKDVNFNNYRFKKSYSKSKCIGVHFDNVKNKWTAQIRINGKKTYLGRYFTEDEACEVYNNALLELNKTK